jgi:tetratricopeptide (TPR) repeat protein
VHFRIAAILAAMLGVWGCGKKDLGPANVRLVVERFENQSAGRDLDRMAATASEALVWAFAADPVVAASAAQDSEQVRSSDAGLWLSAQLRRRGPSDFEVSAQLSDSREGRLLGETKLAASSGTFVTDACKALAQLVRANAPGSGGKCFGAAGEWAALAEEGGAAKILEANPKFWPAYVNAGQSLLREKRRDEAVGLLQRMGKPEDRAGQFAMGQFRMLLASNVDERLAGLDAILSLRPVDFRLREEAASLAQNAKDWDVAAKHFRELSKADPARADWWNALGYAEANRGNSDAAVAAILEYRKRAPEEANPWDSLGEVQFMGRRFRDAALAFDELNRRFPAFQNRNGLWKAAIAWYRAGDLAAADKRHAQWLEPFQSRITPSAWALQKGYWLARTGRAAELRAFWEKEIGESAGERKAAAEMHRAMIEFGLTLRAPERARFVQWSKDLQDNALRQEFAFFGLLSDNAGSLAAWQARIQQAVGPAQMNGLGMQLVATGVEIWAPLPDGKAKAEPLPENPPGPLDILLLRRRIAVLR